MGLKKNIVYSSFLTLSNYIFGLLIFPYVARVLGVQNMGTIDFVTNLIGYFLLFSSFGISTLGIREIAKVKNDKKDLNRCYSSLLFLNLIYTVTTLFILYIAIYIVDRLLPYRLLLLIGSIQVLSTTFLIEWLFRGLEDFRFITIRNIGIKILYVFFVFYLVNEPEDYVLFFALTIGMVLLNAIVNLWYSKRFVSFSLKNVSINEYVRSSISLGIYCVLTSMYTTFNVVFLGLSSDSIQVGYYSTALKIYTIVLGFYTAFTSVMMPRSSSLLTEKRMTEFNNLIKKSFELLYTLSFPLIIVCVCLAPQIIDILAGTQYNGAILPMRIIVPLLFVVGIAQILALQIIIPLQKDKWTLIASSFGAVIGIILNFVLVLKYKSVGTAITLVLTESCVTLIYFLLILKHKVIVFDYSLLIRHLLLSVPYAIICFVVVTKYMEAYIILFLSACLCLSYFIVSQVWLLKNALLINILKSIIKKR